ncbi:MAG: acyl-CoA dehydrogenase family protein [Desulfobacteraceae bacterium]|nr:acyl-CoA dehydrogenase family protein [Desulfobacteraceae bacterium]
MATAITEELGLLHEKVARFAQEHIACRDDLHTIDRFPLDIWQRMGREDLLGVALPATYGGLGHDYLAMAITGETLVSQGHNMGIALSWLLHLLVARSLVLRFGNKDQKEEFLPRMARGQVTASIAASEPGTGAHPKYLKTTAIEKGNAYLLNGKKTYLTNGPLADLFVVIAVTGEDAGQKRFTAFLVPRESPGLIVNTPMDLDFLRPSPHCGIKLENCPVPATHILGEKDSAYQDMVKPFRELEDVLMMGPVVGAMTRQLELLVDLARTQKSLITDELQEGLGRFQSLIHCLRIISYEAATMLDSPITQPEFLSLVLASRSLSRDAQSIVSRFITESGLNKDDDLDRLTRDIRHTMNIAENVARIKQKRLGQGLFSGRELL